jgi:hypothetical protein
MEHPFTPPVPLEVKWKKQMPAVEEEETEVAETEVARKQSDVRVVRWVVAVAGVVSPEAAAIVTEQRVEGAAPTATNSTPPLVKSIRKLRRKSFGQLESSQRPKIGP